MRRRFFIFATAMVAALGAVADDRPAAVAEPAGAAAHAYTDGEAAKHVGETASVTGKVAAVAASKQGNVYLNFGGVHPKQTFSAAIMAKDAEKFGDTQRFEGQTVTVSGVIVIYNGKPEIVLSGVEQIRTVETSAAPKP